MVVAAAPERIDAAVVTCWNPPPGGLAGIDGIDAFDAGTRWGAVIGVFGAEPLPSDPPAWTMLANGTPVGIRVDRFWPLGRQFMVGTPEYT